MGPAHPTDHQNHRRDPAGRIWREFALQQALRQAQDVAQGATLPGHVPDPGYPPHYLVSENARNLLAYAAYIALHKPQPLQGLQRQFPLFSPPTEAGFYIARAA